MPGAEPSAQAYGRAGRGLLALLGMGSSPGKTNVMAARAVRELGPAARRPPARLDSVHVMAAGRDLEPPQADFAFPTRCRPWSTS